MSISSNLLRPAALLPVLGLALSGCGDEGGEGGADAEGETITLGIIPTWTDGVSTAYLWQEILEDEGYEVQIQEVQDNAPLFQGLADGDIDVYPSSWMPITTASYMDEYGNDLEVLGTYYEGAVLTLAVPEYTEIDSIEELNDHAENFDNRVVGIEAGAGHMDVTSGNVFPEYGLDQEFELIESSTSGMLAELDNAIQDEEDIVVTLWRPFWPYGEWDLKDLEDPESHLGEPEKLNVVANTEFSERFPEVAEMMGALELTDEEYAELEDLVVNEHEGDRAGAAEWIENNQELVEGL